jgi:hypothetical protein
VCFCLEVGEPGNLVDAHAAGLTGHEKGEVIPTYSA